jgi:hypothetical protein
VKYLKKDINLHLNRLRKLWIKFHYMLEVPKVLDTKNIISKKNIKNVTMDNQQVTKIINML